MIRRAAIISALISLSCLGAFAQDEIRVIKDTTVKVETYADINDYDLLGFNYGITYSKMTYRNEYKRQEWLYQPVYMSLMYTHYLKLFDYMPFFGYQIGIAYGKEGYSFKKDKEKGTIDTEEGATRVRMEVVEIPFLAHLHFDALHFKVMANAGIYGGYRFSITRTGPNVTPGLENSFAETDIQPDYGLQGGVGFGLIFNPVEFHVNALVRYSWSSIYQPNTISWEPAKSYYYRYAYPFDVNITAGIYIQLTKRTGRTSRDLKRQAREIVIKGWELENEFSESKDR